MRKQPCSRGLQVAWTISKITTEIGVVYGQIPTSLIYNPQTTDPNLPDRIIWRSFKYSGMLW